MKPCVGVYLHVEAEHTLRVISDLDPHLAADRLDFLEKAFKVHRTASLGSAPSTVLLEQGLHLDPLTLSR